MKSKIVIIGSGGRLGGALMRAYRDKFDVTGFSHEQIDIFDFDEIEHILEPLDFGVLINCAALTNVDLCEERREDAFRINSGAPELMADICATKEAKVIHFSTDYVFDGEKRSPYVEEDKARPISTYGKSKLEGEKSVLHASDQNLVVRLSWVFGPERPSFIDNLIKRARDSEYVDAVADKFSTPTYTKDIAQMLLPVLASVAGVDDPGQGEPGSAIPATTGYSGILHFSNSGQCSWQEYAQHALDCCHEIGIPLKTEKVEPISLADMKNWVAERPAYSVLSTEKYSVLGSGSPRPWRDAVAEYIREYTRI